MDHRPYFIKERPNLRLRCEDCNWKLLIPGVDGDSHEEMRRRCAMHVREMRSN